MMFYLLTADETCRYDLLSWLIRVSPLLLIIGVLGISLAMAVFTAARRVEFVKQLCLASSLVALLIGVLACASFNKLATGYQFAETLTVLAQYNFSLTIGVDGISFVFLLLTLFTFPILFLSAWAVTKQPKQFFCHLLGMELLLVLTFVVLDVIYFFVFFESLLIPMFILIGVWGARNRKIKAAYYFFLYTLFGSLFMLFAMIYLYHITGSLNFYNLLNANLTGEQQELIWLCFFLAFAIKMPLFPFHIWLPEAHVEAPTTGSMLLASLLLKLGGYGFLRFSLTFLHEASETFLPFVVALALAGVIYGSLSTLRQVDLKRIIAYSSVSHMNLVVLGMFSFTQQGLEGAIYLMVAHGVVSAALFFCVGVLYDRTHSRLLRYYGGLVTVMPLFAAGFFLFSLANMSFPGTPNFLGELLMFVGIFERSTAVLFLSTPGIVLAAAFSVFLFNRVAFGTLKTKYISEFTDANRSEAAVMLILLILTILLGLIGNIVLEYVHMSVLDIVNQYGQNPRGDLESLDKKSFILCLTSIATHSKWRGTSPYSPQMVNLLLILVIISLNFLMLAGFARLRTHWTNLSLLVAANMFALFALLVFIYSGAIVRGCKAKIALSGLFEVNWICAIDSLTYTMLLVGCFLVTCFLVMICISISLSSRGAQHVKLLSDVAEVTLSKQTPLLPGPAFVAPAQSQRNLLIARLKDHPQPRVFFYLGCWFVFYAVVVTLLFIYWTTVQPTGELLTALDDTLHDPATVMDVYRDGISSSSKERPSVPTGFMRLLQFINDVLRALVAAIRPTPVACDGVPDDDASKGQTPWSQKVRTPVYTPRGFWETPAGRKRAEIDQLSRVCKRAGTVPVEDWINGEPGSLPPNAFLPQVQSFADKWIQPQLVGQTAAMQSVKQQGTFRTWLSKLLMGWAYRTQGPKKAAVYVRRHVEYHANTLQKAGESAGFAFTKNISATDFATRDRLRFYASMSADYHMAIQYGAFKTFYATYLPGVTPPTYEEFTQFRQKRRGR